MPELENCYNRGCGQKYDPNNNTKDGCVHHPGVPYFHDAYKGWSCCNKKSVDFTEFLNIKGCTAGQHSNVKPPEPEKPIKEVELESPVEVKTPQPIKSPELVRPDFFTPLIKTTPKIAPALKQQIESLKPSKRKVDVETKGEITEGTICKNGGCNCSYDGPITDTQQCVHHPGYPVFHEGLKYWSCCTKRTSDFTAFMNQVGCTNGKHKWIKEEGHAEINCRYDWHQTAANVVVAIYAKLYHHEKSHVQLNPIRLNVKLVFPQHDNDEFNLDLELCGVVDVKNTTVSFLGTKVEITMPKAEPGKWSKLNIPREDLNVDEVKKKLAEEEQAKLEAEEDGESDVDLDDIEAITSGCKITEILD